jgi:hypothetical protein
LRSKRVIDWMIASMLHELASSRFTSVGEAAGEHAAERELVDEVLQRSHLLDHAHLLEEVLEREVAREHALASRSAFF